MTSKYFTANGAEIEVPEIEARKLNITWSKAFGVVYCHHASISGIDNQASLFLPEIVRVSVHIRQNTIKKGKIESYTHRIISRYLPIRYTDGYITVDLNSTEIIDALCENEWTTLKGGRRGVPKTLPLKLTIDGLDTTAIELDFSLNEGLCPYTICEESLKDLKENQKIQMGILF